MTEGGIGLSIVIPVYRGAVTIRTLVRALTEVSPAGGLEIVLVNDGSPDNSDVVCADLVREATVPMLYIEHSRNFGEHNAVMTGLRHARGAYVVTMDDDLQNPVDEVVRIYDHARLHRWDVVYSRYAVTAQAGWRRFGSRFANSVADWLLDKPSGLYLSSFRCMSAFIVQAITRYSGPYPYVDGLIMQSTQRIDSIEVLHLPRTHGRSNYTMRRLIRLWLNLATSFSLAPLRLAVWAGVAMALGGGVGAVAVIAEALTSRSLPSGWASIMTVLLLLSGIQSLILGVLGEYVGRTFLSSGGKPQAVVQSAASRRTGIVQPGMSSWAVLLAAIVISMMGQALLKAGAEADTFLHQLFDWRTLLGFFLYGSAAVLYILALRRIPMSVALPCTAVSYVAATLIGYYVFAEPLSSAHIAAIVLISGGVILLVA